MGKKRKSGGRSKGSSGKTGNVQCSKCGRIVPADKAKRYTKRVSAVDPQLARELRQQGSFIQTKRVTQTYCVSCAVHAGKVQIRQASKRRDVRKRR
ncbi:MAG: 30S ribosomal protein S26e [Candidatus Thorarchaeota archaeon]|nr:MAG: 30S ribosomal protein S26e [Candidatus Thorarchaeota archaeon]